MLPSHAAARIASLLADQGDRHGQPAARPATLLLVVLAAFLAMAFHAAPPAGSLATPTVGASGADEVPTEDPRMRFHSKLGAMAGAVALSVGAQAAAQDAVQWRVKDGGNGHWYARTTQVFAHFSVACAYAEERGGHLVTLTSASENSFVAALTPGEAILGGYQDRGAADYVESAGGWRWVTGEPWEFTSWNGGEPNNGSWPDERGEHYLCWWRFASDYSNTWNDAGNDMTVPPWNAPWNLPAIIEWSADCNNDGIVDYGQIRAGELPDANGNNIPDCCEQGVSCSPCAADIVRDGVVNGVDLAAVLTNWGTAGGSINADVNRDGVVNGSDLATVLASWGPCP